MIGGNKMAKKEFVKTSTIGKWAFIVGIVIAILTGFLNLIWFPAVLFVLGVAVGFFNVSKDEVLLYLAAVAVLLLSATSLLNLQNLLGAAATKMLGSILANFIYIGDNYRQYLKNGSCDCDFLLGQALSHVPRATDPRTDNVKYGIALAVFRGDAWWNLLYRPLSNIFGGAQ